MLVMYAAQFNDIVENAPDSEDKARADTLLGLLTPIVKAFLTETGFEATNHGVQVYGGHGFIQEWGMEQFVRDARITLLYEGTTGIQALDLLGRKILMSQGESLKVFTKEIHKFCQASEGSEFANPLAELNREWGELTMAVGMGAMQDREAVGAASVDYLMYAGYVTLGYLWARAGETARAALAAGEGDAAFYQAKLDTARFYFQRILPRTQGHAAMIRAGGETLMAPTVEGFGSGFEI